MFRLTSDIVIECDECGKIHRIPSCYLEALEPEVIDPDREMGSEIEYDFVGEFRCGELDQDNSKKHKCYNDMNICIKIFEYPEGVYNSKDFELTGCKLLSEIKFVNDYE